LAEARQYWSIANELYRNIFAALRMPLLPGEEVIDCTKEEFQAGYDYQLGIDVILRPHYQGESTLQEKFLFFTGVPTVTIEHCQDWRTLEPGDWYKLKAQYYFVGYDPYRRGYFDPWVLLNWAALQQASAQGRIPWRLTDNNIERVGAKASFMYVRLCELPQSVIVASSMEKQPKQGALPCQR